MEPQGWIRSAAILDQIRIGIESTVVGTAIRNAMGAFETVIRLLCASNSAFGFVLHAFGQIKPVADIVIAIDKIHAELFREANIFLFAHFVFIARMDIRVVEENCRFNL